MAAMSRGVHIVALSARTPVGLTPETTAAAVRSGISGIVEHLFMVDPFGERLRGGVDARLDPVLLGWQRTYALAEAALRSLNQRLAKLGLVGDELPRVLLGMPDRRPGWTPEDAEALRTNLASHSGSPIEDVARGHAAALHGMVLASEQIAAGMLDWCIVGGVDSYFDADTLDWLGTHRQLETAVTRSSFFPGEAAGFVALASDDLVRRLGLASLARVRGAASASEHNLIKTEAINTGQGLTEAIRQATTSLESSGERIDDIYCDINGERFRSEEWGFAVLKIHERLVDGSAYNLPVSSWGDVGAASGALFATLAARAWARGYASGPLALLWAGSEGGLRSAVVLEQPQRT